MDLNQFTSYFNLTLPPEQVVKIGKNYFLANEQLKELRSKIDRDIFSLGVFLGQDSGKFFEPSPALLEILSKMPGADCRKIYIAPKVEGLFLYGRNILSDSIDKNPHDIKLGYVFVQNEHDENLGYGIFNQQGPQLVVKNLLDKGSYLRIERRH